MTNSLRTIVVSVGPRSPFSREGYSRAFKVQNSSQVLLREQGSKEDQRDKWGYWWSITRYFQAETSLQAGKKRLIQVNN